MRLISLKTLVACGTVLNIPLLVYIFLDLDPGSREVLTMIRRTDGYARSVPNVTAQEAITSRNVIENKQINNQQVTKEINYKNSKERNDSLYLTPVFENLTDKWQPFNSAPNPHYVFSAFLYKMRSKRTIRIIGAMCKESMNSQIFCQLRYGSRSGNESIVTVNGSGNRLLDGAGFKYRAAFFYCDLPDRRIPETVSLTTQPDLKPQNKLAVRGHLTNHIYRKKFAVCVCPVFGEYDSASNIIQWIELNRILGAELFVFYNFSIGKHVDKVLDFYLNKGLVKVVPWDVSKFRPPGQKQEISYVGQTAALNDCLMRLKPISEFVVNSDIDEVIVPHGGLTKWIDIVNKSADMSIFNFRSSFFRLNWDDTDIRFPRKGLAENYNLTFLLKLNREVKIFPINDRTKYFAKTDMAHTLGVHSVFETMSARKSILFTPDVALIHHYRIIYATINGISQPDYINRGPKVFDDTVNQKYRDLLIDNVIKVYEEFHKNRRYSGTKS